MATRRFTLTAIAMAATAAVAGVTLGLYQFGVSPASSAAVEHLFNQNYPDAAGNPTDLSDYRGKVLVVNFWATWCAPCVEEMPELSAIQNETSILGVQVIGLAVDSPSKVQAFNRKLQVDYPLLVVGASGIQLAKDFGNDSGALPFTLVINREGAIVDQTLGRFKKEQLISVIKQTSNS